MTGVVLIHGFTGAPASFDGLLGRLRARRAGMRACRPTLLGHGTPGKAPAGRERITRFEQELERVAQLVERERFSGAHLLGYSLGARVALGLLARHPYLFSGATLIGVHPGLADASQRAARAGSDEKWCQLLLRRGLAAFIAAWQAQPLFATQRRLVPGRVAEQHRIRSSHSAYGLSRALRVLGLGQMPDYRGALASTPLRVRLVVGGEDAKFLAIARDLAGRSQHVEVDVVGGVGHNVLMEAPEHVERVLLRALDA